MASGASILKHSWCENIFVFSQLFNQCLFPSDPDPYESNNDCFCALLRPYIEHWIWKKLGVKGFVVGTTLERNMKVSSTV